MCKVLIIPGIKDNKRKETLAFINEMSDLMSKSNTDGLGYAAIDGEGNLFAERWLNNGHFRVRPSADDTSGIEHKKEVADKVVSQWGKMLKTHGSTDPRIYSRPTSKNYTRFGEGTIEKNARAITLHTRMATCERGLMNVHPFIDKDTSVIHNGVIQNSKQFDLKLSSCDSESILISYLKGNVGKSIENVEEMAQALYGYYACGVFARDADGNRILDVFKGNHASLSISYIFELETYVLSTSDSDIRNACASLGYTHGGTKDLDSDMLTRINPYNGDVTGQVSFKANANYWNENYNSNRSHGPSTNTPATITKLHPKNITKYNDPNYMEMIKLTPSLRVLAERETEEFFAAMSARY